MQEQSEPQVFFQPGQYLLEFSCSQFVKLPITMRNVSPTADKETEAPCSCHASTEAHLSPEDCLAGGLISNKISYRVQFITGVVVAMNSKRITWLYQKSILLRSLLAAAACYVFIHCLYYCWRLSLLLTPFHVRSVQGTSQSSETSVCDYNILGLCMESVFQVMHQLKNDVKMVHFPKCYHIKIYQIGGT